MISVFTDRPIALDSPDHTHPFGTARDNSVNPRFNRKLYELIPAKDVRLLDLGCAGGGLVKSILDDGGFAVGIDGSDYSRKWKRAHWPELGGKNLFTADLAWDYSVGDEVHVLWNDFNVLTAWEFWEHIPEDSLRIAVDAAFRHLDSAGIFIGSISHVPSPVMGIEYHRTIHDKEWWIKAFDRLGQMNHAPDLESHFGTDVVRGPNEPGSFVIALRPSW